MDIYRKREDMVDPGHGGGRACAPFWRAIYGFVRPCRGKVLAAGICALFVGVAIAFQQSLFLKWFIDLGIMRRGADGALAPARERMTAALAIIGGYLFLSGFRVIVWTFGYRRMITSIESMLFELRAAFFRHIQDLCFRFHDKVSSGELLAYLMGAPSNSIKLFVQQMTMAVPYQLVSLVVVVGVLATFNVLLTVLTVTVAAAVIFLNYRSRCVIHEVSEEFMKTESEASKYVADMLRGCRAIKIYAMEEVSAYSFEYQVDRVREKGVKLSMASQIEYIKPEAAQYLGYALVAGAGAWLTARGAMSAGALLAFLASYNQLMGPLMTMAQLNLVKANAEAGMDRIMRILHTSKTTGEMPPCAQVHVGDQAELARAQNLPCIVFHEVCFGYAEKERIFKGVNCRIEEGETVAIVGRSGSGKTTFISLLLRLYDPNSGRILLNGADLKFYPQKELRHNFGVVPQNPYLFQATLADNVRVSRPDATDDEVRRALETALLDDFVRTLKNGIHTMLGEEGGNLSGGQRQRLAIARAALARPRFFIFDEATSALDSESELRIRAAMAELTRGHTTLIIAHRLATMRQAQRILVFDRGEMVQDGASDELAGKPGVFSDLLRASGAGVSGKAEAGKP